jgi:hypothetical protein
MTIPHRAFISTLHSRLFRFNDSQTLQFILKSQRYGVLEAVENLTVLPSTERQVRNLSRCEFDDQTAEVWQQVLGFGLNGRKWLDYGYATRVNRPRTQ